MKNILDNIEHRDFNKPTHEVLMNQQWFNGIGNYLRAEILGKWDVNPFQPIRNIIDTHHVNYRRKLMGGTLLTTTFAYNESSSPNEIMEYIIKELDPMIRILFRMSSMTQIEKDSFTFKLISYKNYDTYKWYKEIINGIKV